MKNAQLIIDREGRMILATKGAISADQVEVIRAEFDRWRNAQPPELLIVGGATSVQGGASIATRLIAQHGAFPIASMPVSIRTKSPAGMEPDIS